jgi:hypothetical protein
MSSWYAADDTTKHPEKSSVLRRVMKGWDAGRTGRRVAIR